MKGLVSFHPVSLELFDDLFSPLIAGLKVNPEEFLSRAIRVRANAWQAGRYVNALGSILDSAGPASAPPGAGLWRNLRIRMERIDYQPDRVTRLVLESLETDLHLEGRPFFITEGSSEQVTDLVDEFMTAPTPSRADALAFAQLEKLSKDLAREIEPEDGPQLTPEFGFRRDLLGELKALFDLPKAAREDLDWRMPDMPAKPAMKVMSKELPLMAMKLHARTVPFWIGRDVDGLETICSAAGIEPPDVLVPAWRILGNACEEFPEMRNNFHLELEGELAIGGFASPADVPALLDFLVINGSAIIRVATRHGEGTACTALLKKIRECLTYASRHGMGYLEAVGIFPPHFEGVGS